MRWRPHGRMPCTLVPEFQDSCGHVSPLISGIKPDKEKFSLISLQHCDVVRKNPPASRNEGDFCVDRGQKVQKPALCDVSALTVSRIFTGTIVVRYVVDHVIVKACVRFVVDHVVVRRSLIAFQTVELVMHRLIFFRHI